MHRICVGLAVTLTFALPACDGADSNTSSNAGGNSAGGSQPGGGNPGGTGGVHATGGNGGGLGGDTGGAGGNTGGNGGNTGGAGGNTGGNGGSMGGSGGSSMVQCNPTDAVAPGVVTGLASSVNSGETGLDLTWQNPGDSDLAGVLVVAGAGTDVTFTPTAGTAFTFGDAVGADQIVVHVGTGTAAAISPAVPGLDYAIAAWAFDTSCNYSPIATDRARQNPLGPQDGQIQIALDGTVTVLTQPRHFTLSGTATVSTPSIALDLTVENGTARIVHNLRVAYANFNEGAAAAATKRFPLGTGDPITYHGPAGHDVADASVRRLDITGISGAVDPIIVDVHVSDAPMMITGAPQSLCIADGAATGEGAFVDFTPQFIGPRAGQVTPDGRAALYASKFRSVVSRFDLTTLTVTESAALAVKSTSSLGSLAVDADGNAYALVNDGGHWWGGDESAPFTGKTQRATNEVILVKLDPNLVELARITLVPDTATGPVGRDLAIADNRLVATVQDTLSTGSLWTIDLDTFTIIDADPATAGDQPVLLNNTTPFSLAIDVTTNRAFVGFRDHTGIEVIDLTTFTSVTAAIAGTNGPANSIVVRPGKIYVSHTGGTTTNFSILDATTFAETPMTTGMSDATYAVVFPPGIDHYLVWSLFEGEFDRMVAFDLNDNHIDGDGNAANGITDVEFPTGCILNQHLAAITPF